VRLKRAELTQSYQAAPVDFPMFQARFCYRIETKILMSFLIVTSRPRIFFKERRSRQRMSSRRFSKLDAFAERKLNPRSQAPRREVMERQRAAMSERNRLRNG